MFALRNIGRDCLPGYMYTTIQKFEVLVFEKQMCPLKYHPIVQKYIVDIVNDVNDYCSWKRLIFNGIST